MAPPGRADHPVSVMLHGQFDVPTLVRGRDVLAPLAEAGARRRPTSTSASTSMMVGKQARRARSCTSDSDLQGIALDLPAPLDKPADRSMPLHMTLRLPVSGGDLRVSLGAWCRPGAAAHGPGAAGPGGAAGDADAPGTLPARASASPAARTGPGRLRLGAACAGRRSEHQGGHGPKLGWRRRACARPRAGVRRDLRRHAPAAECRRPGQILMQRGRPAGQGHG